MPYKNPQDKAARDKRYFENNRDKVLAYKKDWRKENHSNIKVKKAARERARRRTDPYYKLVVNLRARLYKEIRGITKAGSAVRDLGCTVPELKLHLERQFQPGMTWENYGPKGWHIDHIRPLASFDLTDRDQLLRACHYTNLQPLWAEENLKKGDR